MKKKKEIVEEFDEAVYCPKCNANLFENSVSYLTLGFERQSIERTPKGELDTDWVDGGETLRCSDVVECDECSASIIIDWKEKKLRLATTEEVIDDCLDMIGFGMGKADISTTARELIKEVLLKDKMCDKLEGLQ